MKRSEELAISNIRRIADQLRSERNDALALLQVRTERLALLTALLGEAAELLDHPDLKARIQAALAAD